MHSYSNVYIFSPEKIFWIFPAFKLDINEPNLHETKANSKAEKNCQQDLNYKGQSNSNPKHSKKLKPTKPRGWTVLV